MRASNLHKSHPFLCLNPSHTCTKSAQTSPTPALESISCVHQTCPNLTHSCVWILLIQASNLHKPQPLLRLNPSHACIRPAKTSPTPVSEFLSCDHQTCANLTHSCVWILLIHASNLHKPHPLLRLNPYLACIKLHKPRPLLRLDPSHTRIKPAQTSTTPAFESFLYKHQICTNLVHSCVWILLIKASILHKPQPLLRLNPSHACIKRTQTSPTPASESLSCMHQTCTNLSHSCVWILIMRASNLHKSHPFLLLNPSHTCIKPAQTSPTPASESLSCVHQTCTNLTHSCVWTLLIQAPNLHKPQPLLRLDPSHACIKPAQTSSIPASESLTCQH